MSAAEGRGRLMVLIAGIKLLQVAYALFAAWCVAQVYGWPLAIVAYSVMFAIGFATSLAERQP